MAASFIPALIIKHNNDVYLTPDLVIGNYGTIPTIGAGVTIDGDYWAVPITDEGIVTNFNYVPTTPDNTDAPTPQSFHVFRITARLGNDSWYVRGTTTTVIGSSPTEYGYIQASNDAECCAENPVALPTDVPVLAGCQLMCEFDADGNYFGMWGLPSLSGNLRYYPYGYFNGVLLPSLTATGYATPTALVNALNGNGTWDNVGVWSVTADGQLKVTQTDGPGTDEICVNVVTVNPSA